VLQPWCVPAARTAGKDVAIFALMKELAAYRAICLELGACRTVLAEAATLASALALLLRCFNHRVLLFSVSFLCFNT